MHLEYRNVNAAFQYMTESINTGAITSKKVKQNIRIDGPVTLSYKKPLERVLFNRVRDCNPFLSLYKSLWMLAGYKDVSMLHYYDCPVSQHIAYGDRWRNTFGYDQLSTVCEILRSLPDDRPAVLQMWNSISGTKEQGVTEPSTLGDLIFGAHDGSAVPSVLFASFELIKTQSTLPKLDMTTYSRSGNLIDDIFGNEFCVFSFLQEYVAKQVGAVVGRYNQIINNLYAKSNTPESGHPYVLDYIDRLATMRDMNYSTLEKQSLLPLVEDVYKFDKECFDFVGNIDSDCTEPFLVKVAKPMCSAFRCYKDKRYDDAYALIDSVASEDWRWAAWNWVSRREKRKNDVDA